MSPTGARPARPTKGISSRVMIAAHDTFARAGLPATAFDPSLRALLAHTRKTGEPVEWDAYMELFDQAYELLGPVEMERTGEIFHHSVPEIRAFAALFVSPARLYHFIMGPLTKALYGPMQARCEDLPDGRLRLVLEVPPSYREATAFFTGSLGAMRSVPCHMNLPLAEVEARISSHRATYLVTPPPSRTIAARLGRGAIGKLGRAAVQHFELLANELHHTYARTSRTDDGDERIARASRRWLLTSRQAEVLALVVRGLANKEIAVELAVAERTVELHMTELLRKAEVASRALLIARVLLP